MQVKDSIKEYWDFRSATYTNGQIDRDERDRAAWIAWLRACTGSDGGKKVLDVGTGPGFLALLFAEMGHDVSALDLSDRMVECARENAALRGLNVAVSQGDAESLPYPDASFDIVASKYLLWTLPSPENALAEWQRVLRPGGVVIAIDGEWHRDRGAIDRLRSRMTELPALFRKADHHPVFRRSYDPIRQQLPLYSLKSEDLSRLFERCGLAEVSIKSMASVYAEERKTLSLVERLAPVKPVYSITGRKVR
ncbi:MAG: hypothetical protein A4E28_01681 [Methanocella sp. PtaU1.Bin125]|nr:MAG: hypothetical protein A4E28_01681 [Methanocella sp. PtaU1.Bin125]